MFLNVLVTTSGFTVLIGIMNVHEFGRKRMKAASLRGTGINIKFLRQNGLALGPVSNLRPPKHGAGMLNFSSDDLFVSFDHCKWQILILEQQRIQVNYGDIIRFGQVHCSRMRDEKQASNASVGESIGMKKRKSLKREEIRKGRKKKIQKRYNEKKI
jgi:hypothetical protein